MRFKDLLKANFVPVQGMNFGDIETSTRKALYEILEISDNFSARELRQKREYVMALIEEEIDAVMPAKLAERIGDFAEIKQYKRDDEVIFTLKNRGKRRAFMTIKKGQRGGTYEAARLDTVHMSLPTWTETVSVFVTLEEILLGKYSLRDLMNNILDGFVERLYLQVIGALREASTYAPAANRGSASGIDKDQLDDIIRVVGAYGKPVIMGFHKTISKIDNLVPVATATPNFPSEDLSEIRSKGYVSLYKGIPVVLLPNYIVDENTNAEWLLEEDMLYILPTGEKPVKVALKGEMFTKVVEHATGSEEQNAHKILGVGILLYNNIGVYQDTE